MSRSELERFANRVLDECESTNELARRLGETGFAAGTWISARRQSRGRGRSGREWISREGNLLFSYIARPRDRAVWSWVPLTVAVAACEAIEEFLPASGVAIKWPNDLLVLEQGVWSKIGGILCEGVASGESSFIVIGIGLNCDHAPEGLDQPTARLDGVSCDELRPALIRRLDAWLPRLEAEGSGPVRVEFERRSAFAPGDALEWISEGRIEKGRYAGLGSAGELVASREGGESLRLYSEEVRLLPHREP